MPAYLRLLLVCGPPDQVREAEAGHRQQLDTLRERGQLRLAGRFADGDGYCEILDVEDRHEAERWMRSSPLVEGGLVSCMLREWVED